MLTNININLSLLKLLIILSLIIILLRLWDVYDGFIVGIDFLRWDWLDVGILLVLVEYFALVLF